MRVTPYLNFSGNCEEAFRFYEQCLGGKITALFPHAGTPAAEHVPADWQEKIMHACLEAGDVVLMGSDSPCELYEPMKGMYVSLHPDDVKDAERIYHSLAEGAEVRMPLQETFWAARFGMLVDRFGTPWMINCSPAG